jgi:protoporphyrin/coproporphyrin ferrochelatase
MNLGSPDSTSVKDLRRYLNEFLMDERVIDVAKWWRTILVKGIIVPLRAPKSAAAYKSIWTAEGSPLIVLTKQLRSAVEELTDLPVEICMRYGNPSPKEAMDRLKKEHSSLQEVILFPLYPHYAMSSYETAVEYAKEIHEQEKYPFALSVVPPFYNNEDYISALTESIRPYLDEPYDLLLFSYHGIPERHVKKTDCTGKHCLQVEDCCHKSSPAHAFCYRHQVITTTELVAQRLGLPKEKYAFSFQSRLGRDPWLQPYTAKWLETLPSEGIKRIAVVCPAFVSDCLETLEEMGLEGKEIFLHAGGDKFTLIPCMNVGRRWAEAIVRLVVRERDRGA